MPCPVCKKPVSSSSLVGLPTWLQLLNKVDADAVEIRIARTEGCLAQSLVGEFVDLVSGDAAEFRVGVPVQCAGEQPPRSVNSSSSLDAGGDAAAATAAAQRKIMLADLADVVSLELEQFAASLHDGSTASSNSLEMALDPDDVDRRAVIHEACDFLGLHAEDSATCVTVTKLSAEVHAAPDVAEHR